MSETRICEDCGQEVVKRGLFWVLPSEIGSKMVAFCPANESLHEVEDEDE